MSALKKKEKELSLLGVSISGLAMALAGAIGGFLFLASFPAKSFSVAADREAFIESRAARAPMPGDIFYMEGPTRQTNSWLRKRTRILSGEPGTVDLSAGELNAWIDNRFQAGTASDSDSEASVLMVPRLPNFHIGEGQLSMSLPVEATFYGNDADFTVLGSGTFGGGASPGFKLSEFRINNAAIPPQAGIARRFMAVFLKAYQGSDEYTALLEAWQRVESAEVTGGVVRIVFR